MKALLIAVVRTLVLAIECQVESKSSSLAINDSCPCGNISTMSYTRDVESSPFLTNSSDEVKEAIKTVIGELIEKKIQAVVDNLKNKIETALNYSTMASVED